MEEIDEDGKLKPAVDKVEDLEEARILSPKEL